MEYYNPAPQILKNFKCPKKLKILIFIEDKSWKLEGKLNWEQFFSCRETVDFCHKLSSKCKKNTNMAQYIKNTRVKSLSRLLKRKKKTTAFAGVGITFLVGRRW